MRRTSVCAVVAIVAGLAALPAATSRDTVAPAPAPIRARRVPDVSPLPDGGIERRLERGDDHRYRFTLSAGEYLRVIVEQHGIDLIAQTRDTAALPIADFRTRFATTAGKRWNWWRTRAAQFTIAITALPDCIDAGCYDSDGRPSRGDRATGMPSGASTAATAIAGRRKAA
jgi:hypothetical protein